ncbi:CREB-regulated transcription coactivator 1-like isoform X4 [Vespula pensylvanica]|uniref:CREB-regulated transcription coactivator 1-like isoform X4 n=1 Tax=Vespula pensylvanica TaxID=30213 RepID=UPI001CBA2180|nr:CREB-regulated transcription coactivator 1-like isoform X4 [Vespula pensylvanica]XP_050863487.1 CREB-regulated transcription coactivator 1 isoform X4 [Vespula vulgaris]
MANPRKFSEKIALLNQKEAQETAAFEAIMREVSDVTSRVASASSSVGASPTGSGVPDAPLSVKSAGASPPQSSGKHLHINLGNQFRAGGSLPNVNNNANCANDTKEHHPSQHTGAVHSIDLKTALSNLEEMQHNSMVYRSNERGRHMGVGPVRSRPMEKRHDTSPYSGVSYLSPSLPDTWRRTNSDSALHQSANEACQSTTTMPHRRDQHNMSSGSNDNRETHHGSIERPRSSCEMPRVPGINIYLSSQPPGQQIPIGNNTGSLPDLSNVHFPSPLHTPLDQEDHSSSTPFSNSPQTSSPTNLSPTSLAQAGRLSLSQDHNPPSAQQGVALENSTSTSQQDLQSYSQQPAPQPPPSISHSPAGHYIYQQQPHSPVPPQSPKTSQSQQSQQQQQHQHQQTQQLNSLGSYRTSQPVNRPSPQSSPSLTVQGSPLSYSNNPSAPPSPTGHPGPPTLTSDGIDQNSYVINQAQAAALQQDFEQFTMMDTPVSANTIGSYIGSPNHTTSYAQNDMINVGGELGSGDGGYYSTSPQVAYQPTNTSTTTTQQLTPQTPNTPTIILTDFSGADDLTNPEFVKDLGTAMMSDFDPELFPTDDALRQGLGQIDVDGLQMLTDPTVVISDPSAEAHFRLDRL